MEVYMNMPKKLGDDKLLKLSEVLTQLRISKSAWYDGVRRKIFPQPVKIGTRTVVWWQSDIDTCVQHKGRA
jgi:prophage regulatory protein